MRLRVSNKTEHPDTIEVQLDLLSDDPEVTDPVLSDTFVFSSDTTMEEAVTEVMREFNRRISQQKKVSGLGDLFTVGREFDLVDGPKARAMLGLPG